MGTWAEKCAERMTKTLNKAPRHHKTRVYVKSLPKRDKAAVRAEEFERLRAIAKRVIETVVTPRVAAPRKHRLTPAARKRREVGSKRNCRSANRFRQLEGLRRPVKPARDADLCRQHRHALHRAQSGICAICGHDLPRKPEDGSLDHCIPLSLGGIDGLGNIVLTHGECNGEKTNDIPTGCELVWLLAVNARLGVTPVRY